MSIETGRLAFAFAGRAAHQGWSSFGCAGAGKGNAEAPAFGAAIAAVTAAPALMKLRRPMVDPEPDTREFFLESFMDHPRAKVARAAI
jgi:hypothetical protein